MGISARGKALMPAATLSLIVFGMATTVQGRDVASVMDRAAARGWETSIALDLAGTPLIAYHDATNGDLKLLLCSNPGCKGKATILVLDAAGNVGRNPSLAMHNTVFGAIPVIAYYDATLGDLKVLRCGDARCSSGNTISSPDQDGTVGQYPSLRVDANGFPVVSYYDATNGRLKVLHCGSLTCSAGNSIETPDPSAAVVGRDSSLALDASGNPVISYYDATNFDLKVLHCDNANCSGEQSANIVAVDSVGNVGEHTSLVLDGMGAPVVAYYAQNDGVSSIQTLRVLHCGNAACTAGNSIATPDAAVSVGWYTSLLLNPSGYPVVSYFDFLNNQLRVLACGNGNCTANNTVSTPDAKGSGFDTSLALDLYGNPLISYTSTTQQLKLMVCDDMACRK